MSNYRAYLAGPIQHAHDHGKGWRARIPDHERLEWVDPMAKYDTTDAEYSEWTDEEIVEEDLEMIDACDGLFVHWEEVPTCGTPMEIRYAYERGMPIVVQTTVPERRLSPWLTYHIDAVGETFEGTTDMLLIALDGHLTHGRD